VSGRFPINFFQNFLEDFFLYFLSKKTFQNFEKVCFDIYNFLDFVTCLIIDKNAKLNVKKNSEAFADYLSAIRDHIIQDREIWETFKTVLFPAMKKENQIFYMNVMKNI